MRSIAVARLGAVLFLVAVHSSCGTARALGTRTGRGVGAYGSTGAERAWSEDLRRQVLVRWNPWEVLETPAFWPSDGPPLLTVLHMRIRRDGRVQDLGISHESGIAPLDQDAVTAVKNAQPLPPPPREIGDGTGAMDFELGFRVYRDQYPSNAGDDERNDRFAVIFAAADRRPRGTLAREAVMRVISQSTDTRRCVEGATTYPVGNATIRLHVTESGNVTFPAVVQSTGLNRPLEGCLLQAMSLWTFAPPRGGHAVIHLRVSFTRGSDTQPGNRSSLALADTEGVSDDEQPIFPPSEWTRQPSSALCQPAMNAPERASESSPSKSPASSGLDKEVIRKVMDQHREAVKTCYDKRMVAPPYPHGKLTTRFSIDIDWARPFLVCRRNDRH
jgi:TonB family protein